MSEITVRPLDEIVAYLASTITKQLEQNKSVLWLVPGGSASVVALSVLKEIEKVDTSRLYITLTDERFGPLGHPNENWTQLQNAGFQPKEAKMYRVLVGDNMEVATKKFASVLDEWLHVADYKIGLFGIGIDGHTAGIKPHTDAVTSDDLTSCFQGEDFERITITPKAINMLDEAVAYAQGKAKFSVLEQLTKEQVLVIEQPAQSLKYAETTIVFSDFYDEIKENI